MTKRLIHAAVLEAIALHAGHDVTRISDSDALVELGVDSMMAMNLILSVEDRLGAALPEGAESGLAAAGTVGGLVDRIAEAFSVDATAKEPPASSSHRLEP